MINPMPFEFEPCAKETPAEVKMSSPRIQSGGAPATLGSAYSSGFLTRNFIMRSRPAAQQKPTTGESKSA